MKEFHDDRCIPRSLCGAIAAILCLGSLCASDQLLAQQSVANERLHSNKQSNRIVIELFYRGDAEQSLDAERFLQKLGKQRTGIDAKSYDVLEDRTQLKRLWKLSKRFGYENASVPTFYLCDSLKVGFSDPRTSGSQIEQLLTIKAYIRPGCKHCKAATRFLDAMKFRWPALRLQYFDVVGDPHARAEVQRLAALHRVRVASFPCIQVAGRLIIGYQSDDITGHKIESYFQDRSVDTQPPANSGKANAELKSEPREAPEIQTTMSNWTVDDFSFFKPSSVLLSGLVQTTVADDERAGELNSVEDLLLPAEDIALPQEIRLPDDAGEQPLVFDAEHSEVAGDQIDVPWLGQLSVSKLGLPAFTFLIGLVDGFNPCAMWVLVFLLSILVNIKDRRKIILVAGTFVIVSGLAYFVFMAAWFSVFQLIGLLRPVQIGLGVVAIIIGAVNVKDFFAFHRGITFSIPESAKPGIYRRVRQIVSANYLTTALVGAVVLAVVVNIVELLCTAGLPALYTEVLTMQKLPTWANYSYLALYIGAYMLDDAVLVAIVVTTLSHRRLQESEGRWLKLLSGSVILLLGLVMIWQPNLLV